MRQAIIAALKTKFEGLNDATYGRIADKMISSGKVKTVDDVANAVAEVTLQQIFDFNGDSRADEAQKTTVKNYEKKHNLKDGKPVKDGNDSKEQSGASTGGGAASEAGSSDDDSVKALLKQVLDGQKSINDRLDGIDREKTANSRQTQLAEILKNAPQSVKSRYEKDFARMSFKDDDEFAGWLAELTPDIEQMSADMSAKGAAVGRPKGGAHGGHKADEPNPYLKARVEAREKAVVSTPAIQGLTTNS